MKKGAKLHKIGANSKKMEQILKMGQAPKNRVNYKMGANSKMKQTPKMEQTPRMGQIS